MPLNAEDAAAGIGDESLAQNSHICSRDSYYQSANDLIGSAQSRLTRASGCRWSWCTLQAAPALLNDVLYTASASPAVAGAQASHSYVSRTWVARK